MIKRLWRWGIKKFWNKKFIKFCIIGVCNTLIHMATLWLMYRLFIALNILQEENLVTVKVLIGNAVAFTVASIFSYFAHNYFTFKNKERSKKEFWESMFIFAARFGLTELLTFILVSIFKAMKLDTKMNVNSSVKPNLAANINIDSQNSFLLRSLFLNV
ncbi:MAG: GtrA family protein, partial [bacterium]|nr:GtrA family protein [bacterium]